MRYLISGLRSSVRPSCYRLPTEDYFYSISGLFCTHIALCPRIFKKTHACVLPGAEFAGRPLCVWPLLSCDCLEEYVLPIAKFISSYAGAISPTPDYANLIGPISSVYCFWKRINANIPCSVRPILNKIKIRRFDHSILQRRNIPFRCRDLCNAYKSLYHFTYSNISL